MSNQKKAYSLTEFIKLLHEVIEDSKSDESALTVYRGHSVATYEMIPSLFRSCNSGIRSKEAQLLREIEAKNTSLSDMTTLEKLVTLQHYEFPTRLLDVTLNPLVALYFAAASRYKRNGAVIICRVPKNLVFVFDNDTVVQMANLANLSEKQQKALENVPYAKDDNDNKDPKYNKSAIATFSKSPDTDSTMNAISRSITSPQTITRQNMLTKNKITDTQTVAGSQNNLDSCDKALQRLANFVKADLPSYSGKPEPADLYVPVYVKTKQTNPRIEAQNGAFILFGTSDKLTDDISQETIIIPRRAKKKILRELDVFAGINSSQLFPEFDKFLSYLRDTNAKDTQAKIKAEKSK